jgi:hypothetical protein
VYAHQARRAAGTTSAARSAKREARQRHFKKEMQSAEGLFVDAHWRSRAQIFARLESEGAGAGVSRPISRPSIVAALKQEYINFYKSIEIDHSPSHAKNAFGSANPDKKGKQAVRASLTSSS